jgi:hypothetical protein
MDIVTHSVTLISIIVGLGLTEMFNNLHRLIAERRRVRWDPLPFVWMAALFMLVLNYWWGLYLRLDGSQLARTAAQFGLILLPAILIFLSTASVLPKFEATEEWDMRLRYQTQRKVFLVAFALFQVCTGSLALMLGRYGWDVATVARTIILVLLVAMLIVRSRRLDWVGAVTITGLLAYRLMDQTVR